MPDGGSISSLLAGVRSALGLGEAATPHAAIHRASFTAAVIGLSAKLSKSDGVTLAIEEETFERLFPVPPDEVGHVRRLFALTAQDTAGFESYAAEIARALAAEPTLKRDVFEALLHIASADGVLHPGEDRFLATVAGIFGYTLPEYRAMRAHFVSDPDDPYVVLGASRELSNAQLKAHYRGLVKQHHPDALAAKGLARELAPVAQRKLAVINAAWDEIARERGL